MRGPSNNDEDTPPYRAMMIQKKLAERIDRTSIPCTVDKVVEELLGRQGIPWMVNERASLRREKARKRRKKRTSTRLDR